MEVKAKSKSKKEVVECEHIAPKTVSGRFVALSCFETSEGKSYEVGDLVSDLKSIDLEALFEMGAIAEEK